VIIGSLCTGYGGLEMGLRVVFPFARLAWVADNDRAASVLLAARFAEWMMGVPDGWVTDLGFSRKDTFRLIGNGVVPLQAALAVRGLIDEESNCDAGRWPADGVPCLV
jgi:site-specific DNA-cytosine methylase